MTANPARMASFEAAIRDWIDGLEGDIICPLEGQKMADYWRDEHRAALRAWLDACAGEFIAWRMGAYLRSKRSRHRTSARTRDFSDMVERFEDGDVLAFSELDTMYTIDEKHTRRPLREMTKADLQFAAVDYENQSNAARLEVAYLTVLARRTPVGKTVGDVFTDKQLFALRKATE